MKILQVTWEIRSYGIEEVDLDDLDLTEEEWNLLSYEEQFKIAESCIEGVDLIFPTVDTWNIYTKEDE